VKYAGHTTGIRIEVARLLVAVMEEELAVYWQSTQNYDNFP
jgi:hypothetical protein